MTVLQQAVSCYNYSIKRSAELTEEHTGAKNMAYEEELNSILEEGIEGGDDSMKNRFLTFEVGDEFYGIEILYVTEIVSMQKVTEVPDVPEYIKGVINLRGQVIPVIDVRARFKLEAKEYDDRTCAIVVNVENAVIGLIVDSVDEVINIPEENIGPSPAISESQSCRFIKGMGRVDGNVIILLSVARLLNDDVLEGLAATGKQSAVQFFFITLTARTQVWRFYYFQKNGLDIFSLPTVVSAPCPGIITRSSGRVMIFSLMELSRTSRLPPGKSVRPKEPAKIVSPQNNTGMDLKQKQTPPGVCPGV
eukprot:TRINITY_DN4460_c0_g1_i2.p4 TRINITY_DN4460_c0_g1~~TRINITY_DN4460_c0_g1_i2.p4  ORF type:complete len:306 (+),score=59.03 TRINITY_DN4460_c0_g1_i2:572-1489(+)